MDSASHSSLLLNTLKWMARTISVLMSLFVLLFALAYTFGDEQSPPSWRASTLFAFWIIGTIVAWKRECVGGGIILFGTILALIIQTSAIWPPNPLFLFPISGILFIICCMLKPKSA